MNTCPGEVEAATERVAGIGLGSDEPTNQASFQLRQDAPRHTRYPERLAARVLPDPAVCRAKRAGFGDYADCLVVFPLQGPQALSFGAGFLCCHPARAEIVRRTVEQGSAAIGIA